MKKKTLIILGGILFMTAITRCNSNGSRKEIEARFEGFVSLYPTNNLMDLYDKEGDRNQDFDKNDKGTWIIDSSIYRTKGEGAYTEGMMLRFNRNTRLATGYYYIRTFSQKHGDTEIEYPIYYGETGIHLLEDIEDEEVKGKILNFKFLAEHISFEGGYIQSLPLVDKGFNVNVPLYNVSYRLTTEDDNLRRIKQQYAVTENFQEQPRLILEGSGSVEWGPRSRRTVIFSFDEDWSLSVDESISFGRSVGMRD